MHMPEHLRITIPRSPHPLSDDLHRLLLQSSKPADVFVPATKTKTGDRAFRVAASRTCNSLRAIIQEAKSRYVCKNSETVFV